MKFVAVVGVAAVGAAFAMTGVKSGKGAVKAAGLLAVILLSVMFADLVKNLLYKF